MASGKNAIIVIAVIAIAAISGCTGPQGQSDVAATVPVSASPHVPSIGAADPLLGNWTERTNGLSSFQFMQSGTFYEQVVDIDVNGSWGKIDDTHYRITYLDPLLNKTLTDTITYNPAENTFYVKSPEVVYARQKSAT